MPLLKKIPCIQNYPNLFLKKEFPAKHILLKEGKIAKKLYFIENGSIRLWFNDNGKEISFQFFFEGDIVSSIESLKTNTPSLHSIETMEKTIAYEISKKNFFLLIKKDNYVRDLFEQIMADRLIFYQRLFLSRIKDKPQKRYEDLLINHPEIIQRVPLHYISSFLGLTPVSLSRIRSRKAEK